MTTFALEAVNASHAAYAVTLARCATEPDTGPRERAEYRAEIARLANDVMHNAAILAQQASPFAVYARRVP